MLFASPSYCSHFPLAAGQLTPGIGRGGRRASSAQCSNSTDLQLSLTSSGIGKNHIRISIRSSQRGRYSIRRSCSGCCHGLRPYATQNMLKRSPQSSDPRFAPRDGMKFAPMCKGNESCLQRRSKCVAWVVCVC